MNIRSTFAAFAFIFLIAGCPQILNSQCGGSYIYKGIYEGHAYFYSTASLSSVMVAMIMVHAMQLFSRALSIFPLSGLVLAIKPLFVTGAKRFASARE